MGSESARMLGIELRWLSLHLQSPHVSSLGAETDRPVVISRVVTEGDDGWGECAALASPTYCEEYAEGAWSVLIDHLVPLVVEASPARRVHGSPRLRNRWSSSGVRGHSMAKACLEMALLDSELRRADRSFADRLGSCRDQVDAGAIVGLVDPTDPEGDRKLLDAVEALASEGYERVKVKIVPGADLRTLGALRRAFPDLGLQADANGAYRLDVPDDLMALESLDDLDLLCVEQPLDPDDLAGHALLAQSIETPVCLDESVSSLGRLRDAIALGACDMVCLKPARSGGLLQAVAAHDICRGAAVPVWCGGMLETCFARSANQAMATLPGFTLPGDLTGGERFFEPDPFLAGAGPEVPRRPVPLVPCTAERGSVPHPMPQRSSVSRPAGTGHRSIRRVRRIG